ncbi:MAG: hypothetical protein EXS08_05160 [Planctomycetes bacterium]|nr:hypothetical protein [Planctomycetota bacterium]
MLRWLGLVCLFVLVLLAPARAGARAGESPNVVLIVWNDATLERLGFLGAGGVTARLDALLAGGARFPRGTQVTSRGRPTGAVLLTGRTPHASGIYYQTGPKKLAPEGTLGALLAARGYATLHAGKLREGAAAGFGFAHMAEDLIEGGSGAVTAFVEEFAGKQPLFVLWAPAVPEGYGAKNLDGELGALLDALAAKGALANTLFAFVTNGDAKSHEFTARECAEARVRNPLAFVWPGHVTPGERAELVTPLDVLPTLLDLLAVPPPAGLEGRSLGPLLAGAAADPAWAERSVLGEYYEPQTSPGSKGGKELEKDLLALTLRQGGWKYALYLTDIGVKIDPRTELATIERSAGDQELFDLEADPLEQNDLFGTSAHAEQLAALRTKALELWKAGGGPDFVMPFLPPVLGPAPKEPRPNIVLVIADDMDYEHLGFMGNARVKTPTLDALAQQGCVFPVAHVPMSRCRPALAALLSGRWPQQTGIYENEAPHTLTRKDSLPNLLKAAGYATFQGGKFWEGSQLSMGFVEPKQTDSIFKTFVRENQDELFSFIDRWSAEHPLFVWWAPMLPHGPFNPPARFQALFRDTEIPVPPGVVGDPKAYQEAERTSYAMGAWLDDGLSALRAKLAAKGELENTLFVFLIDNGFVNGAPSKGTVFEKGLRTPVFFSWPKGIAGGRTSSELVCAVDLYRTILDYAGVPAPSGAAGIDLRPTLDGAKQHVRDALYGAVYRYKERPGPKRPEKDVYAIYARTPRWKFVLYLRKVDPENYVLFNEFASFPARERGQRELFDLEADPYERNDLARDSSHAVLMDELLQGCLAWWKETGGGELDLP